MAINMTEARRLAREKTARQRTEREAAIRRALEQELEAERQRFQATETSVARYMQLGSAREQAVLKVHEIDGEMNAVVATLCNEDGLDVAGVAALLDLSEAKVRSMRKAHAHATPPPTESPRTGRAPDLQAVDSSAREHPDGDTTQSASSSRPAHDQTTGPYPSSDQYEQA